MSATIRFFPGAFLPCLLVLSGVGVDLRAQGSKAGIVSRLESASDAQIQALLARFPEADADGDGILTRAEAIAYAQSMLGSAGKDAGKSAVAPTHPDVAYGPHERNRLDFWSAEGEGPKPLVVFIHGGGFTSGDKSKWRGAPEVTRLLERGVSCAAINYRLRRHAPIQEILRDAARAVQFLRAKSDEWSLDKARFAGWGSSAGAGTALWLATREDLADPAAEDALLRESTRLQAAVLLATQATYDLTRWDAFLGPANPAWWTSPNEAAEFYHLADMGALSSPEADPILRECDMLSWISPGDGPFLVNNRGGDGPSQNRGHYLHHPAHAREIAKHCEAAGVSCQLVDDPAGGVDPVEFVLAALLGEEAE